ncbi:g6f-like isoform X2 [Silurus meridionalis]|nr:g6f-like isoform X2 [Silurus meridionalis]
MSSYSLLFTLTCIGVCFILPSAAQRVNAWSDVIVVEDGAAVTLLCPEEPFVTLRQVEWLVMPALEKLWTMLFSVNVIKESVNSKQTYRQAGRTLLISNHNSISLQFTATMESGGLYNCLLEKDDKKIKEKIVLLAVIKLTLAPAPVIYFRNTARLKAEVSPSYAVVGGTWVSHTGSPLFTIVSSPGTLITKLPLVTKKDSGTYTCNITVDGRGRNPVYSYTLRLTVNEKQAAIFPNITYGHLISLAALSRSSVTLPCAAFNGDYVLLYWWRPDLPRSNPQLIFQFDRWRNYGDQPNHYLQLHNHYGVRSGNFSFLLKPELKDAGRYQCEVFVDDQVFAQLTMLTVLKGSSTYSSSSVELTCEYSERSQVDSVKWTHVRKPQRQLAINAVLGRISISIDLPLTQYTAGQYACTLILIDGPTVEYRYTPTMPTAETPCCVSKLPDELTTRSAVSLLQPTDGNSTPEPSVLLPSLSLLLFLVPMIAVAVGVLLWRRGPCTFPQNVERTLSHYSGEVENIYENPEDVRQSPSPNAVYMDLKFTGETDIYRELDR